MSDIPKRDRMKMERTPSRTADPEVRSLSFDEVNVGYTSALAVLEASRCLNCKRPVCIEGCPVGVRIDEVPMSPPKVHKAIKDKARGKAPRFGPSSVPSVPWPEVTYVPPPWEGGDGKAHPRPGLETRGEGG